MSIFSIYAHIKWTFNRKAVACFFAVITAQFAVAQSETRVHFPSIAWINEFLK